MVQDKPIDSIVKEENKETVTIQQSMGHGVKGISKSKLILFISLFFILLLIACTSGYFIWNNNSKKPTDGLTNSQKETKTDTPQDTAPKEIVYGPFTSPDITFSYIYDDADGYGFYYTENGKQYVNANGKILGPYNEMIVEMKVAGSNFAFLRGDIKGPIILNVNGTDYGDLCVGDGNNCHIPNFYVSSSGDYAFDYCQTSTSGCYIVSNGKKYGPYDSLLGSQFYNDKFGFSYKNKDSYYVNINGVDHGPFRSEKYFFVYGNNYGFEYEYGPTYEADSEGIITGDKSTIFGNTYITGKDSWSLTGIGVNINGKNYVDAFNLSSFRDNYGFVSKGWSDYNKDYFYYNFNGNNSQTLRTYSKSENPEDLKKLKFVLSDKNFAYSVDSYYSGIMINGKEYGQGSSFFYPETVDDMMMGNAVNSGIQDVYFQNGEIAFGTMGYEKNVSANYYYIGTKKYGPYGLGNGSNYAFKTDNNYLFSYSNIEKTYININGTEYGPYDEILKYLYSSKEVGFKYRKGADYYCNFLNKEYGPYDDNLDCQFLKDKYILKYKDILDALKNKDSNRYYVKIIPRE